MASNSYLKTKSGNISCEIFRTKSIVELERKKERDAAIKIHSWFRKIQVQQYVRYQHECATVIQKTYRAYVGRKRYRRILEEKMRQLMVKYYALMATKIQSQWRGYYVRKYRFNFYTRKAYLNALILKNESVRLELENIRMESVATEEAKRNKEIMDATILTYRKQHHLLSTAVRPGVYNSPNRSNVGMEAAIRILSPLSKQERALMEQTKRDQFLKTANGIPSSTNKPVSSDRFQPLPPLKSKPQGPFRHPEEVQKQRYKELRPTLRVATDYESVDKARYELRDEEWTRRIIDKKFLPSTKREMPYSPSLHATSSYQRPDYGTKHFRESNERKFIQASEFHRVVSPIPYFDQLGKTY